MKPNFVKYIFIIIVISLICFAVYFIYNNNNNKNQNNIQEEVEKVNYSKEITMGISEYDTINPSVSVLIYNKLRECEKDVQLYLLEGADHGGSEFWTEEIQKIIINFFSECKEKMV